MTFLVYLQTNVSILKGYLLSKLKTESMTILEMQQFITENKIQEVFPYIEIVTRMFFSIFYF